MGKVHYGLQSDHIPEEEDVLIEEPALWVCEVCGLKVWFAGYPEVEKSDHEHRFVKKETD